MNNGNKDVVTGNTPRDRIRNEDIRNICQIQDVTRCGSESGDHVNKISGLQKSQKMEKRIPSHLDGLQKIVAKVGHQLCRRTGTLDEIYRIWSYKKKKKKKKKKKILPRCSPTTLG